MITIIFKSIVAIAALSVIPHGRCDLLNPTVTPSPSASIKVPGLAQTSVFVGTRPVDVVYTDETEVAAAQVKVSEICDGPLASLYSIICGTREHTPSRPVLLGGITGSAADSVTGVLDSGSRASQTAPPSIVPQPSRPDTAPPAEATRASQPTGPEQPLGSGIPVSITEPSLEATTEASQSDTGEPSSSVSSTAVESSPQATKVPKHEWWTTIPRIPSAVFEARIAPLPTPWSPTSFQTVTKQSGSHSEAVVDASVEPRGAASVVTAVYKSHIVTTDVLASAPGDTSPTGTPTRTGRAGRLLDKYQSGIHGIVGWVTSRVTALAKLPSPTECTQTVHIIKRPGNLVRKTIHLNTVTATQTVSCYCPILAVKTIGGDGFVFLPRSTVTDAVNPTTVTTAQCKNSVDWVARAGGW